MKLTKSKSRTTRVEMSADGIVAGMGRCERRVMSTNKFGMLGGCSESVEIQ